MRALGNRNFNWCAYERLPEKTCVICGKSFLPRSSRLEQACPECATKQTIRAMWASVPSQCPIWQAELDYHGRVL